jgi:hypothetical protein
MDPSIDLQQAFLHEQSRKVYKDSTLTLDGILYEVPAALIGKRVTLRYHPCMPLKRLQVMHEGVCYGEAHIVDSYANTRVKRNLLSSGSFNIREDAPQQTASLTGEDPKAPLTPAQRALAASRLQVPAQQREVKHE